MEQTQQKQRPMGLTKRQIEWCDEKLHGFREMRLQAERSAVERESIPAASMIAATA